MEGSARLLDGMLGRGENVLHSHLGGVVLALEWMAAAINLLSILVMLVGVLRFVAGFAWAEWQRDTARRVERLNSERMGLGRYILSGLELLIVADIIHTALSLALSDLLFLGLLVLIRSLISFFLDREIKEIREELSK